jgi:hypothetical protein
MSIVKVACSVVNGVMIRLYKEGYDDGTGDGIKPMVKDGPGVRLRGPSALYAGTANAGGDDLVPEITEVDAEWFAEWMKQNAQNPMVTFGAIRVADEKGPNPT